MDSLAAVELTAAIEDEMGIELPLTAVHDFPTLEALCAFIERGAMSSATRRSREHDRGRRSARMTSRRTCARLSEARLTRDARSVLLTGATGFVGAHLVRALAAETDADIHCLVRPRRWRRARARCATISLRYGVWSEALESRLHVVQGDLTLPRLGLSTRRVRATRVGRRRDLSRRRRCELGRQLFRASRRPTCLAPSRYCGSPARECPSPFTFFRASASAIRRARRAASTKTSTRSRRSMGCGWGTRRPSASPRRWCASAGERGLTVTIIRPSLITGDARVRPIESRRSRLAIHCRLHPHASRARSRLANGLRSG